MKHSGTQLMVEAFSHVGKIRLEKTLLARTLSVVSMTWSASLVLLYT